jgi:hypothetical protein
MNNVLLGAIEAQADYSGSMVSSPIDMINLPIDRQTGGGMVSSPIDMITLPIDTQTGGRFDYVPGGPSGGGGDISMERLDVPAEIPAEIPAETKTDSAAGMSKKNMLLIGIGALVLGYLFLRKK